MINVICINGASTSSPRLPPPLPLCVWQMNSFCCPLDWVSYTAGQMYLSKLQNVFGKIANVFAWNVKCIPVPWQMNRFPPPCHTQEQQNTISVFALSHHHFWGCLFLRWLLNCRMLPQTNTFWRFAVIREFHLPQRCKKRLAWLARLCYFFPPTVLIFGLYTRKTC